MCNWTDKHKEMLTKYSKAIVHIRKQQDRRRFSLVFGAGISEDFKIPTWGDLINRIAQSSEVKGRSLLKNENLSHTSKTQMLFQHFKTKCGAITMLEGEIKAKWRSIIRRELYKKSKKDIKRLLKNHPYLGTYVPIIRKSSITINYNFDDYIERIILSTRSGDEKNRSRCYETVWDSHVQSSTENPLIYHPNGFLPENKLERPSNGLVFCEDEFADQLIESMAGRYASLLHYYASQTCLFIGLSLNDSTLKHLLRQNAIMNPGHYHYYIAFQEDRKKLSKQEQGAIFNANFELYNFITLFLSSDEIKIIGELVTMDHQQLTKKAELLGVKLSYYYYITGAIAAGKSSIISCFNDFITYDEWLDFREPLLLKPFKKLTKREKEIVDKWISDQFSKKNFILTHPVSLDEGLNLIDRGPLDPVAFTPKSQRSQKADMLLNSICPKGSDWRIQKGQVILLHEDPETLEIRAKSIGKKYSAKELKEMQNTLQKVYSGNGLIILKTNRKPLKKVVKEVARIIHVDGYNDFDLQKRLNNICNRRFKC